MKIVQLGANRGKDSLYDYITKNKIILEFGLFIEANSLHIDELKACYQNQKAIIENVAIKVPSYDNDTLELFYATKDGPHYEIASSEIDHIHKHMKMCPHLEGSEIKSITVPCITLENLFEKHNVTELDWLLIDLEGIDAELLLTTDWSKYNINKIEFEIIHLDDTKERIRNLFTSMGYIQTNALHKYDEAWMKKPTDNSMKVTLYAIAKNEEENVDKFIKNTEKFDDVVVVDTGSTDNTVQLLKDAGIKVYEHPQKKEHFDFSVARNTALSYVTTEWAFSLDFNEDVSNFFPEGLSPIESEFTKFNHLRFDDTGEVEPVQSFEVHTRFHRTKNYKWVNAVHETLEFIPTETHSTEVSVDLTTKITKKINRTVAKELFYLSLCEREHKKDPTNWYYIWFIFNHYVKVKNTEKALKYGQVFLNESKPYFNSFRVPVFIQCSRILLSIGDVGKGANYAFHALSEAMNMGGSILGDAFVNLLQIGKLTNNPNIIVFASAFSENTLRLKERTDAIDRLFLTNLDDVPATAWFGHRQFAENLVNLLKPNTIVDLGVDWGFSTFSFAIPKIGHTYGIDNFVGDEYIGVDNSDLKYNFVCMKKDKLHLNDNLTFIKGDFNEVAETWDKQIDILHIDGSHKYEDIKRDFDTWSKFVTDDGVILIHDTEVENLEGSEYGVKKFFDEIDLPKFTFTHSYGLGVVCKNERTLNRIKNNLL